MSDFDNVMIATVGKLLEVNESSTQTHGKLTELLTQLMELNQKIDEDSSEVKNQAQSLLAKVTSIRQELSSSTSTISSAIAQLQETVDSLQQSFNEYQQQMIVEINNSKEEIISQQNIFENEVDTSNTNLSNLQTSYKDLYQNIQETNQEFEELLNNEFTETMQNLATDLDQGIGSLTESLAQDVSPSIVEIGTELKTGLEEMTELMADSINELLQQSRASSEKLMQEVGLICQEYQNSFNDEKDAFQEFIHQLALVFSDQGKSKVEEDVQHIVTILTENHTDGQHLLEIFEKIQQEFNLF